MQDSQPQYSTQLVGRELLYTGISVIESTQFSPPTPLVTELMKNGEMVRVDKVNAIIEQYNKFSDIPLTLPTDTDCVLPPKNFVLPLKYRLLDITAHLDSLFELDIDGLTDVECLKHAVRYKVELEWFKARNRLDLLRTLVYIVDVLEQNEIVWGVGRGSSTASYILYLIGVHEVHPVKYDLDYREFLRD